MNIYRRPDRRGGTSLTSQHDPFRTVPTLWVSGMVQDLHVLLFHPTWEVAR